jgi:hypothetical protein
VYGTDPDWPKSTLRKLSYTTGCLLFPLAWPPETPLAICQTDLLLILTMSVTIRVKTGMKRGFRIERLMGQTSNLDVAHGEPVQKETVFAFLRLSVRGLIINSG